MAYCLDTPATWTAVAQWFLMRRAAANGVRVVLSGEGADEVFLGYARYRLLWHVEQATADPVLAAYGPLREYMLGRDNAAILARLMLRSPDTRLLGVTRALVERFGTGRGLVADAARVDFYTTMQALLRMADRMAAAHSIENRSPFLDYRIMEWGARLPGRLKIDRVQTKAVLRHAALLLGVPTSIVHETTKRGMAVPWPQWSARTEGIRGAWDRAAFHRLMLSAWRQAFSLGPRVDTPAPAALSCAP